MKAVTATLGVFDGFHRGHRAVINRARERADAAGERVVALTFDVLPRAVLAGEASGAQLMSLGEKVGFLRAAGVEEVRVLRFDPHLAAKDPEPFLREHLLAFHPLSAMVVGHDFALGKARQGTIDVLRHVGARLGFEVESIQAVEAEGAPISSSRIREALLAGKVEEAARWLGRDYHLEGTVVQGDGRGRELGFPTANLEPPESRLCPGRGVYAVWVEGLGDGRLPGVANLGRRPTFGGEEDRVEVHVLASCGNLLGVRLRLSFVRRLRAERKFAGAMELRTQIEADITAARGLLGPPAASPEAST